MWFGTECNMQLKSQENQGRDRGGDPPAAAAARAEPAGKLRQRRGREGNAESPKRTTRGLGQNHLLARAEILPIYVNVVLLSIK